jgi:hypothetical protein
MKHRGSLYEVALGSAGIAASFLGVFVFGISTLSKGNGQLLWLS